jgi:hypothetical protein
MSLKEQLNGQPDKNAAEGKSKENTVDGLEVVSLNKLLDEVVKHVI